MVSVDQVYEYLSMNGYGFYIWSSYIATFVFMTILIIFVILRKKRIEKKINVFVNINQNESIDNFDPQQYWNSHNQIEDQFKGWGYFQLFHLPTFNRIHSNLHQIYPTLSNDAGADDLIFAGMFFNILDLDTFCIHLSEPKVNWKGIK